MHMPSSYEEMQRQVIAFNDKIASLYIQIQSVVQVPKSHALPMAVLLKASLFSYIFQFLYD